MRSTPSDRMIGAFGRLPVYWTIVSIDTSAAEQAPGCVAVFTAAEFRDDVLALAKGLLTQGVTFGDRVGIMCRTRYEWTLFDFALWTVGAQPIPLYPTSLRTSKPSVSR